MLKIFHKSRMKIYIYIYIYIFARHPRTLTLNDGKKKKLPFSGRIVEKSKDF